MMALVDIITDPACSDECGLNDLPAELKLEICSCLDVHDQQIVRKICKSWRLSQFQWLLAQYVDMDGYKLLEHSKKQGKSNPDPADQNENPLTVSENLLKHAVKLHVQTNTQILVLRHVDFNGNKFGIVARVIQEKATDLTQLIFKDCEVQEEYDCDATRWWLHPQRIALKMLYVLTTATNRLILENLRIGNVVSGAAFSETDINFFLMPSLHTLEDRMAAGNMFKKLPIFLPYLDLTCCGPFIISPEEKLELFLPVFHSFMLAVDAQCPPISPDVRDDLVQLCSFWKECQANQNQWRTLDHLLRCLNEGVFFVSHDTGIVDIEPLRMLDPLTLNNLTNEVLHRMYCLPPDGTLYTPTGFDKYVKYVKY